MEGLSVGTLLNFNLDPQCTCNVLCVLGQRNVRKSGTATGTPVRRREWKF